MDGSTTGIQQSRTRPHCGRCHSKVVAAVRAVVCHTDVLLNVRGETADLKLKQWLNTVERELKAGSASSPAKM